MASKKKKKKAKEENIENGKEHSYCNELKINGVTTQTFYDIFFLKCIVN